VVILDGERDIVLHHKSPTFILMRTSSCERIINCSSYDPIMRLTKHVKELH